MAGDNVKKTVTGRASEDTRGQSFFIDKIREANEKDRLEKGHGRAYSVVTFGCQMNAHDSEKIEAMFMAMGYEKSADELSADIIAYNTCCVRENAENRLYGNLGRIKHLRGLGRDIKVVLCGCMMQRNAAVEKIKKTYSDSADVILGTFNLHVLPELLWTSMETGGLVIDIWDRHGEEEAVLPYVREKSFKAAVNIMYGCDNFCSYCIVPYVRGRERSRPSSEILSEAKALADGGVKEIMLLGQNVNSYSTEYGGFAGLLRGVSEIGGIERVRFMTSHPKDLSDELIEEMKNNAKLCRHIHLPLQSGSDELLRRMNRRYTRESYTALYRKIKEAMPGIAITTDIITGFPGESEKDVDDTLALVRELRFSGAYTFLYSKREGTPAALMENQIDEKTAKQRFQRLLGALNPIIYEENAKQVGLTLPVLAEEISAGGLISGRADNNALVHFAADASVTGQIVNVKITECKTFYCMGELSKR
jgi:tRNA-2-methylthio-N6-dimethylallyladenosine synthase